jgi:hypothetical protein
MRQTFIPARDSIQFFRPQPRAPYPLPSLLLKTKNKTLSPAASLDLPPLRRLLPGRRPSIASGEGAPVDLPLHHRPLTSWPSRAHAHLRRCPLTDDQIRVQGAGSRRHAFGRASPASGASAPPTSRPTTGAKVKPPPSLGVARCKHGRCRR